MQCVQHTVRHRKRGRSSTGAKVTGSDSNSCLAGWVQGHPLPTCSRVSQMRIVLSTEAEANTVASLGLHCRSSTDASWPLQQRRWQGGDGGSAGRIRAGTKDDDDERQGHPGMQLGLVEWRSGVGGCCRLRCIRQCCPADPHSCLPAPKLALTCRGRSRSTCRQAWGPRRGCGSGSRPRRGAPPPQATSPAHTPLRQGRGQQGHQGRA